MRSPKDADVIDEPPMAYKSIDAVMEAQRDLVDVVRTLALLRPGGIDYKLYLGKASDRQKVELYRRFFPESSEAAAWEFVEASGSAETMAEFQGQLLALEVKSFEKREESSDRVAASHGILA